MNQYDEMLEELVAKLSPLEQQWFAQCKVTQELVFALMRCPRWRFMRRAKLQRQLMYEVTSCSRLHREVILANQAAKAS